jgi:hypothetical protein
LTKADILPAWGRILRGYKPLLSIEITRNCPLRCPGCYAYEPEHLGGRTTLQQLADYRGPQLVEGVLALVRRYRPMHVSIVGGEPLVRYRELGVLLPKLDRMRIEVQLVTSAVRLDWSCGSSIRAAISSTQAIRRRWDVGAGKSPGIDFATSISILARITSPKCLFMKPRIGGPASPIPELGRWLTQ